MKACQLASQQFGADHPDYGSSLNNLVALYMRMGDYTTAEPFMRQALEITSKALGEDHLDYAILHNLAVLYKYMGKHAEAAQLYHRLVNTTRTTMGDNSTEYIASLDNLAELYRAMGNDAAAEPLLRQALEIRLKPLGEDHPRLHPGPEQPGGSVPGNGQLRGR